MDVSNNLQFEVHIGPNKLPEDLRRIREVRTLVDEAAKWEINLLWKMDNREEHNLVVYAKGPALAVEGFQTCAEKRIDFFRDDRGFNYKGEKGARLNYWEVRELLEELRRGSHVRFAPGDSRARNAYVICVFMASEIVRSEILEKLFLKEMLNRNAGYWDGYLKLYENWSSVAGMLYGIGGQRAPAILVQDVKEALDAGKIDAKLAVLYQAVIDYIQS